MSSMRRVIVAAALTALSCGPKASSEVPVEKTPEDTVAVRDAAPDAAPIADAAPTKVAVQLIGKQSVRVSGTGLTAVISGSFHKSRAPVVGVSVLVSTESGDKAEVSWRIELGKIDGRWIAVSGRRYDNDTNKYVEEEIPGWQVRLDSVDDESVGGDPTAITVSFQRASTIGE